MRGLGFIFWVGGLSLALALLSYLVLPTGYQPQTMLAVGLGVAILSLPFMRQELKAESRVSSRYAMAIGLTTATAGLPTILVVGISIATVVIATWEIIPHMHDLPYGSKPSSYVRSTGFSLIGGTVLVQLAPHWLEQEHTWFRVIGLAAIACFVIATYVSWDPTRKAPDKGSAQHYDDARRQGRRK